jgi:hypothetical protein
MIERQFPILGTSVPPMLGRAEIIQRMLNALTKPVPDHLQVVGPRFAGKTVILQELARRVRDGSNSYSAVLLWDLGRQIPETDELFMERFATELANELSNTHADYATHLRSADGNGYHGIEEVLSFLQEEGCRVLAIMDGFDKPLSNAKLTRNLWDQLRELASKPNLTLVASSRKKLSDLQRQPEAQSSPFWNIFNQSLVRIGCFDQEDMSAILDRVLEPKPSAAVKAALWSATNGSPVMTLEVLNFLCAHRVAAGIHPDNVKQACDDAFPSLTDTIGILWSDCRPSCHDLFRRVTQEKSVPRAGHMKADVDALIEKGFLIETAGNLHSPSCLVSRFLEELPNEGSTIARLFSTEAAYSVHLRGALERRIAQLEGLDPDLQRYLENGVEDFPERPGVFAANIRGIVNRAFELIWNTELGKKVLWMGAWRAKLEKAPDEWEGFRQGCEAAPIGGHAELRPRRRHRVLSLDGPAGPQSR